MACVEKRQLPSDQHIVAHRQFKFAALVLLASALAFCPPRIPFGLEKHEWQLAVMFCATVLGIVARPYPSPMVVLFFLALGSIAGIVPEDVVLSGYSSTVVWTVLIAFFLARAFSRAGLGKRLALVLVKRFGNSLLGVSYCLATADVCVAPLMPSNTARGGGIIYPIARAIASELEAASLDKEGTQAACSHIIFTAFQTNVITSAMFLTAMAANPLALELSERNGGVRLDWFQWAAAAAAPGIVSLVVVPLIIRCLHPIKSLDTSRIRLYAQNQLELIGPLRSHERKLLAVVICLIICWAVSSRLGVSPLFCGVLAVCALILWGVLEVDDITADCEAWSTFLWLGGVISLSAAVSKATLFQKAALHASRFVPHHHPMELLLTLVTTYLLLHYLFVGITTQILTVLPIVIAIAVGSGVGGGVTTLYFCFFSSLYACLTHYGSGPAPIFFESGYVTSRSWLLLGFIVGTTHIVVWSVVGSAWFRFLGYR